MFLSAHLANLPDLTLKNNIRFRIRICFDVHFKTFLLINFEGKVTTHFFIPYLINPLNTMDDSPKMKKKVKKAANFTKERSKPNILVTGTPGVGKSLLCQKLCERVKTLKCINIGEFAKENDCLEEWDEDLQSHAFNEDKVIDELEDLMGEGGVVIEHHVTDFFPERWFDIVFVLRTDNTLLYDRLTSRGYEGKKLENNMDCEIFQTILDEARCQHFNNYLALTNAFTIENS